MKENLLTFDLQLFNDTALVQPVTTEDTTTLPVENVAVENPDVPVQTEDVTITEPKQDVKNDFEFMLDENGNLIFKDDEVEIQDTPVQQDLYTPDEIEQIGIDKLDPAKIPAELLPYYKKMQADYTRKTQDLSQRNKDIESQLASLNQNNKPANEQKVPDTSTPAVDPKLAQRQYYENVYKLAKGNIEEALGEPFDEINPLHMSALADEVASIKAYVVQEQIQQQQLDAVVNKYTADPEWNQIQAFGYNVLNNLPYSHSNAIRQRLKSGDIAFIDQFISTSKDEYYKTKNGAVQSKPIEQKPVIVPPKVESAGLGAYVPNSQTFDTKNLRGMTNDQLANAFVGLGLTKL